MAISSANAQAAPKTRRVVTLTSGTSWTVPSGVTYVNALLVGGGGGGGDADNNGINIGFKGQPGDTVETTVTTTPGASITYAIGAGGTTSAQGGSTTFTGATTAVGGLRGTNGRNTNQVGSIGSLSMANNGGNPAASGGTATNGGAGGSGWIVLEYWV